MPCDIVVSEQLTGQALADLSRDFTVAREADLWRTKDKLRAAVREARALIVRNQTQVDAELIAAGERLEIIGRAGAGLDNIDVAAASAAGIVVASTPDQNSISVAELAIGFMFALARHIPAADRDTRGGGWSRQQFAGMELNGKTLGIVGIGRIGFLTALRARALGMRIIAHDQFVNPDAVAVTETHAELVSLDELLHRADFVSCHTPLTAATRGMFNYDRFATMRPTAFFLNLARGEVVNEADLARALREKRLAGAALDVRETEPPGASPLNALENVILTPHIAAFTREAQDRVLRAVCADVAGVLRGGAAKNFANFPQPRRK
jgi:D-3-phosphoglycerate dehydrogenase / 2-oxoglutarate reductase